MLEALTRANTFQGRRHSDGAVYTVKKTVSGWRAERQNKGSVAGDVLTAPTLAGIEYRLAQS